MKIWSLSALRTVALTLLQSWREGGGGERLRGMFISRRKSDSAENNVEDDRDAIDDMNTAWGKNVVDKSSFYTIGRVVISRRFANVAFSHMLGNIYNTPNYPLIFAIHGPPGHGKSMQASKLLESWGVNIFYISGSELEGAVASGPAIEIRNKYRDASRHISEKNTPSCLFIDDIDAGIGDFGAKTSDTVNRQIVSSLLMNLADKPTLLQDERVERVPIFVTANRLESLYVPLRRPGRMTSLYWRAEGGYLLEIIRQIFGHILQNSQVEELLVKFPHQSPAFFQQVYSELLSESFAEASPFESRKKFLRYALLDASGPNNVRFPLRDGPHEALAAVIEIAKRVNGQGLEE